MLGALGNCGVPDLGAACNEHLKARGHHRLAEAGGRRGQGAERDQVTERHEAIQRRTAPDAARTAGRQCQVKVTVRTRSNPSLRRLRVRRGRRLLARHAAMPRQRIESPNPDMSNGAA